MTYSMRSHEATLVQQYKSIAFLVNKLNFSSFGDLLVFAWVLCGIYLGFHIVILVLALLYSKRYQHISKSNLAWMHIGYVVHSRVLFFIIQMFLFFFLRSVSQVSGEDNITRRTIWAIFTALFSIINLGLAVLKEFMLYQTMKAKSFYSVKNNMYHQIILIYKTTTLLLDSYSNSGGIILEISSALHVLFAIVMLYVLFRTLPFYEFKVLKTAMILTAIIFSGSLVSVLHVSVRDIYFLRSLYFFALILPVFMVKIVLSGLEMLLGKILRGEFTTPEYAIHYALLLKEIVYVGHRHVYISNRIFSDISALNTGVKTQTIGFANLNQDTKLQADYKPRLAQTIMSKLEQILHIHPKSSLILLFMAELHLKKLGNNFKAIELINRIQTSMLSFSTKAAVEHIRSQINERHNYSLFDCETRLLVQQYFSHNKIANNIKSDILQEIQKHIELWQEVKATRTDVKKVTMRAEAIDQLYVKIQTSFQKHDEDLRALFPLLALMKAVYLDSVRIQPIQGEKMLSTFKALRSNLDKKNTFDICSKETGVLIISLERYKSSKITYASGSIENLFNHKKSSLIGYKFENLFPAFIAKKYQNILQQYVKSPDHKFDYRTETVGVTADGHLFELEVQMCQYSLISHGISMIALLKKKSEFLSLLIANHNGDIVTVSERLKNRLAEQKVSVGSIISVQSISHELGTVNQAFNFIHKSECIRQQPLIIEPKDTWIGGLSVAKSGRRDMTIDHLVNNNSGMVSANRERDVSGILLDPHNVEQSLNSQRSMIRTPSKVRSLTEDYDNPKRAEDHLTPQKAQQICERFGSGTETVLTFESLEHTKKKLKVEANISFKATVIDSSVYKVIKILDMNIGLQMSPERIRFSHGNETSSQGTFADEFLSIEEKNVLQVTVREKLKLSSKNSEDAEELKIQILDQNGVEMADQKMRYSSFTMENVLQSPYNRRSHPTQPQSPRKINVQDTQRSSVKSSRSQEIKIIKMLEQISERKVVQPKLRSCLLIIYSIILLMVVLSSMNFYYFQTSVQKVKNSIESANIATQRIQETVRMLQYSLLFFSSGVQAVTYSADLLYIWHSYFTQEIERFIQSNNELKKKFSITEDKSLIEEAFAKTVMFKSSLYNVPNYYGELDTFTAADILLTKYKQINSYSDVSKVAKIDDILLTFNNTSNGFLISSQQIITKAQDFVNTVTSRSLLAFYMIFFFQIILLLLLFFVILSIVYIIFQSYTALFRSLTKLNEERISNRISQLTKVRTLFEGDVDSQHFVNCSISMFNLTKPVDVSKPTSKSSMRSKFVTKNMLTYLLRITTLALLLSSLFGMLFGLRSFRLISSFNSLQKINKQLSILNQASYQANMLICAINYRSLFPSYINMLIYNLPADQQIVDTFVVLRSINDKLRVTFLDDKSTDEFTHGFLTTTLCQYFPTMFVPYCESMYKDGKNGLIFANEVYYQTTLGLYNILLQNPTPSELSALYSSYAASVTPMLSMLQLGYPLLVGHILEGFDVLVERELKHELIFFVAIIVYTFISVLLMHFVSFKKLQGVDLLRRKIIKIVPYQMVEDRIMSFYLKNEFPKEVGETGAFR